MKANRLNIWLKSILAVLAVFALVSFSGCSKDTEMEDDMMTMDETDPPKNGDGSGGSSSYTDAPDFNLKDLNGNDVKKSDFDGKVLVMFFFGNSCPSCRAAGPSIQSKIATAFGTNAEFTIIGLDQWDGNQASVQSFKSNSGVNFPLLLKAATTASAYGSTYDRLVVVDKEGKIRFNGTRNASKDVDDVATVVTSLL